MENKARQAKDDRRLKYASDDEKIPYDGPERRSGEDRRIWVDRAQEILTKMTQRES